MRRDGSMTRGRFCCHLTYFSVIGKMTTEPSPCHLVEPSLRPIHMADVCVGNVRLLDDTSVLFPCKLRDLGEFFYYVRVAAPVVGDEAF